MTHILHLDASPRGARSVSRTLSKEFISGWKAAHPNDTVTYRDIGHSPVPFVSEDWIAGAFTPPEQRTLEQTEAIRVSDQLIDEFLAADRYVFGIPMYNFSIPANFKAYIDQIVRAGRTFLADETGYKGLVHNKKMTIILAQGEPIQKIALLTPTIYKRPISDLSSGLSVLPTLSSFMPMVSTQVMKLVIWQSPRRKLL